MKLEDQQKLFFEIKTILADEPKATFAIIGHTSLSYDLISFFHSVGAETRLLGVYAKEPAESPSNVKPLSALKEDRPTVAIIASDQQKEKILEPAIPSLTPNTRILIGGYGHFAFGNPVFEKVTQNPLVPSLANGYPNTLIHLFQCLQNAARLNLSGIVVEFGMFKGGTTAILANFVKELGQSWNVIGFDTFAGFPPRRNVLDMYNHPGCLFADEQAVRNHVERLGIEVISGDIVATVSRLVNEKIVLAFVDTDNFTPASAVLDVIQDRVVMGGAIVFDHFTGRDRFLYTLGERIAAKRLLNDFRYFNLHDTGVFFKQR